MIDLLLTTALAAAAAGATPPDAAPDVGGAAGAHGLEEVIVTANRQAVERDKVGQSVTVLTLPEIRADQETLVSDLLQRTPGVQVSRNGGPGGVTAVRIRGAESDQTVVLIDGVKLNDPSSTGGGYNFADLATGDIARIEVLRGPQSTLYGSQAIGGVVNLVTADPTRALEGDAQAEGGSYATGYAKAGLGGVAGRLTWRGAVSTYVTDGVSAFDRRFGGREADGYHNTALTGRAAYAFTPEVSAEGRVYYAEARNRFDGFAPPTYAFGDTAEFGRTQQLVVYGALNTAFFDGRLKNRLAVQSTRIDRQSLNPAQAVTALTFDSEGVNRRVEEQGALDLAKGYTLVFGAEREESRFSLASPSAFAPRPAPTRARVAITSGYGQLRAEPLAGLTLVGGVRYDDHDTFGGHTTGQASAAWSLFDGATVLRASYGGGFKAPTLYQLYSPYGSPGLRPEAADGYDAGVEQRFWGGRASVQATGFRRDSTNLIGFASCPFTGPATGRCIAQPFGYYANTARARAQGVELSGAVRPAEGLEISGNYTFTDAVDRSPGASTFGRDLARRPRDMANLGASYRWPGGLTTALAARYAGASFDDAANTVRLKSYTLIDLRASLPLRRGIEAYGRVENLFDRPYETAYRYGALGRAAYAGLRANF